ncbi:hypothetical protein ACFWUU_40380 [Kribbella sp. NPDC058693]|uniref:hypothetical protein n=1 Tax=Kribbella sp. NPDC058693 TaxID=3346602 RepID=UPI0036520967
MSKADELKARAAAREARRSTMSGQTDGNTAEADPSADAPSAGGPRPRATRPGQTIRVKPVKVTVELQPIEHQGLTRMTQRYAEELQLPRIAGAEVFRVLLDLLQHDEDLAERVGQELARTGGTRRRESRNSATP